MLTIQGKIYLSCGATDMRKSINGLSEIVKNNFQLSPFENTIFVFCNKSKNRLKILHWEENGFWIHFKRLERGRFYWPDENTELTLELDKNELMNLINSPGVKQKILGKSLKNII